MNRMFMIAGAATLAFGGGSPALADDHMADGEPQWKVDQDVEVLERNEAGKATIVMVGDAVYPVCMTEANTDGCIQPRAAGLGWGPWPAMEYVAIDDDDNRG